MIASLLIGLLPFMPTDDAEGATAQLHPYFERATAWVHDPCVPTVEVDGQLLPHRFTVPTTTQHFHLEEAEPLEFVLVLPNVARVDGVELPVASPFYMCTTELSNAQFAQLRYYGKLRTYADFEADMSFAARLDPDIGGCDLDHVADYFADPRKPVVGMDLADAAVVTRRLSDIVRMRARLPHLGEWFQAMQAGSGARYWWGDEHLVDRRGTQGAAQPPLSCQLMQSLTEVDVGEHNPLGLVNMLNNVAELVMPSDEERAILGRLFGPHANEPERDFNTKAGMALGPHTALAVGGSVQTLPGWVLLSADELVTTWEGILGWSQVDAKGSLCVDMHWATGIRLVIDIPDGEWRLQERALQRQGGNRH